MPEPESKYSKELGGQGVPLSVKQMFASMETSNKVEDDWLQLEENTFLDLQQRGKVAKHLTYDGVMKNPRLYDEVATAYVRDLNQAHGIPTVRDAALWSYRPGWYKKYRGNIDNIPETVEGSHGKTGKQVMLQRLKALIEGGY